MTERKSAKAEKTVAEVEKPTPANTDDKSIVAQSVQKRGEWITLPNGLKIIHN